MPERGLATDLSYLPSVDRAVELVGAAADREPRSVAVARPVGMVSRRMTRRPAATGSCARPRPSAVRCVKARMPGCTRAGGRFRARQTAS